MKPTLALKVGKSTSPNNLKAAIVGYIKSDKKIFIDAVGVVPNYVAVKAIILAKGHFAIMGISIKVDPTFTDLEMHNPIDRDVKTAVRYVVTSES